MDVPDDDVADARYDEASDAASLTRLRIVLVVHAAAWSLAVLPPALGVRAIFGSAVGAAVLFFAPTSVFGRRTTALFRAYTGASVLGALAIGAAFGMSLSPVAVPIVAATVLTVGVHLLALAGLDPERGVVEQVFTRPFVRDEDAPWASILRRCLVADAGLTIGAAFTGIATIAGGLISAAVAVAGYGVLACALAMAAIDVGVHAPRLLPHGARRVPAG